MPTNPLSYEEVEVGTELPTLSSTITRADLVAYCGATGDHNVIHWNQRIAQSVGLPDVISHGMLTMARAGRVVSDWTGDPGSVVSLGVRFSRPVVVPDDDTGASLEVSGSVTDKLDDRRVAVALTATVGGEKVLMQARAVVQLR